jgi:hypothetical protein
LAFEFVLPSNFHDDLADDLRECKEIRLCGRAILFLLSQRDRISSANAGGRTAHLR